ncbi:MAG: ada [Bacteroidetes bacterium]|nr:ada [Bacteroidota bacterium]
MENQNDINFRRITRAIEYIYTHFREQPHLDRIASEVNLSPFHFQRMFSEWAGVGPKKFLQYITVEYAKKMLKEHNATLLDTTVETGLSGTSRLHDLFIHIEGMTPGEYKNGGENLMIHYRFAESPFGTILIASTPKGICHLAFADDKILGLDTLKENFPKADFRHKSESIHQHALSFFERNRKEFLPVKLHVKGTGFQLKIWEALLKIPKGHLSTYGEIAAFVRQPKASRAVGSAIGDNPVAFLIPCHRVILSSGIIGHYHWGNARKTAMIGWEAVQTTR